MKQFLTRQEFAKEQFVQRVGDQIPEVFRTKCVLCDHIEQTNLVNGDDRTARFSVLKNIISHIDREHSGFFLEDAWSYRFTVRLGPPFAQSLGTIECYACPKFGQDPHSAYAAVEAFKSVSQAISEWKLRDGGQASETDRTKVLVNPIDLQKLRKFDDADWLVFLIEDPSNPDAGPR